MKPIVSTTIIQNGYHKKTAYNPLLKQFRVENNLQNHTNNRFKRHSSGIIFYAFNTINH
jgi:hypothetical protein